MEIEQGKGLGYLLERTTRLVKLSYSQEFKANGFDITPEQWVIMESLYENPQGQYQNELVAFSFKDAPTISRIIDLLTKKGIVSRATNEKDKRSRNVRLTEEGNAIVEKMQPLVAALRAKGWDHLSKEDFESFVRIINQVFENYKS